MDALQSTTGVLQVILLAVWFIMWAIKSFVAVKNPIYIGVMGIIALIIGILFLLELPR